MVSWYTAQRLISSRDDASIGRPMRATARLELWLFFVVMYAACSGVVKNFAIIDAVEQSGPHSLAGQMHQHSARSAD